MIKIDMLYAEELRKDSERLRESWEINYTIRDQHLLKMKDGYREMAEFNQSYSEIGLMEDVMTLMGYEEYVKEGSDDGNED